MDEYYIKDDFPGIMIIVFFINWMAWMKVTEDFWFSLLMGIITYSLGWLIYKIVNAIC